MDAVSKVTDWNKLASSMLKAELKRRDIGYEKLVTLLDKIGVEETHSSILNKMSRGTFQFSFFFTMRRSDWYEKFKIGRSHIRFLNKYYFG